MEIENWPNMKWIITGTTTNSLKWLKYSIAFSMSTVLANQINFFRPNFGRIFHRVRGNDCTRPCFIEWLKWMHSFCAKSKKTQFSNKAYLSNGTRFPVLKGRTIRKVMWRRGGGIGWGKYKKKSWKGRWLKKIIVHRRSEEKKLLQSEFHRRGYKLYPIKRHLGSLYRSFMDPGGQSWFNWFSLQIINKTKNFPFQADTFWRKNPTIMYIY